VPNERVGYSFFPTSNNTAPKKVLRRGGREGDGCITAKMGNVLLSLNRWAVEKRPFIEVETVIPVDDPSEPCYDSETVQLLREIKDRAERGDVAWLTQKGKVYPAVEAA
jgi:hypothetical protein